MLENIVFVELVRHGWSVTVGDAPCGKAHAASAREIDFLATKGSRKLFIQVCYLLAEESTVEREFSPLESVRNDFPKYVLSMDKIDRSRNGIVHQNSRTFLLEADRLLK